MTIVFLEDIDGYKRGEQRDLPRETALRYLRQDSATVTAVCTERTVLPQDTWEPRG